MSFKCDVFPLFSSPVCSMFVEENLDGYFSQLKNFEYNETQILHSNKTLMTDCLEILEHFPDLKSIILKYFNLYKNDILKYEDTEFKITTSWMTKCYKNSYSQLHAHKNSLFSGVLYFETYDPLSYITFEHLDIKTSFSIIPTIDNIFNSLAWKISVEKNKILFFPSHLPHRIDIHSSDECRYSLAFNLFPIGKLGGSDSSVNITINRLDG